MAFKILGLSFRDLWQELWTILIVHLLFLIGLVLIIPGPPVFLALFFYGNLIARGETATEQDFLRAVREYWVPAWRWGLLNLAVVGLLAGDYYLTGKIIPNSSLLPYLQGFYAVLLAGWLLVQLFALPFLFEQQEPLVLQALQNAARFIRKNFILSVVLALLLVISLAVGALAFMLTFVFGGAFLAFAGNHAVLLELNSDTSS